MPTTAEDRFWAFFDKHDVATGGPQESDFADMSAEERSRIEATLLGWLAEKPLADQWVVMALGALRSNRAEPLLRSLLAGKCAAQMRVTVAAALWRISADSQAVDEVAAILCDVSVARRAFDLASTIRIMEPLDSSRIYAASVLGTIGTHEARQALLRATHDANSLVREAARQALRSSVEEGGDARHS